MHSVAICAQVVIVLSIAFVWIVRYSFLDLSSLGAIPHGPGHSRSRAVSVGALYTRFVVASWMYALLWCSWRSIHRSPSPACWPM
jgi:hypothetical protein